MTDSPTFSVVMPAYNYGHFLPGALDSVLAQGRPDTQIVLVDDGSTDDTPEVARAYGDRLTYLRNARNLGAGGAWARGLEEARGEYVMKLDADDELLPGFFDAAERAFRSDAKVGMVIASVLEQKLERGRTSVFAVTAADRTLSAREFRAALLRRFFFHMPGCMLRRRILAGHQPPDAELYQVHDWEYFLRVTNGHSVRLLRQPLALYRIHGQSITSTAKQGERLYRDLNRWLSLARQPGERHLDARELRRLHGGCAAAMLVTHGARTSPATYARFARNYLKANRLAAGGGPYEWLRLQGVLVQRVVRFLAASAGWPVARS